MPLEDHELLAEWSRTHYERALRTIVERRLPQVMGAATRMTRSPELAIDVAGKAFMKLAGQPPRVTAAEPLSGWLLAQTRPLAAEVAPRAETPPPCPTTRGLPADWAILSPFIDDAIDSLAAAERDLLLLRFFEGNSVAAISERCGLDDNAVKTRITKALDKLREWLDERGVTVSTASLATMLAGHANEPVTPELVAAIANNAIEAPRLAPAAPTSSGGVWVRRASVALAAVLLVAAAVWLQSRFQDRQEQQGPSGRTTADDAGRRSAAPAAKPPRNTAGASTTTQVARALELAAAGKADALADWAGGFTSGSEIEEFLVALRADPQGTPALRAVIARYLTSRWADIDPASCIQAFLREGALHQRDPFDSGNHPLLADTAAGEDRPALWDIIAKTNPDGLDNWLKTAPADLVAALLGDRGTATFAAWSGQSGSEGSGQSGSRNGAAQGASFLASDFAALLLSRAPALLLRPGFSTPEAAARSSYYDAFIGRFAEDDGFSAALLARFRPDDLWQVLTTLPIAFEAGDAAAFARLAAAELAAARPDFQQAAASAGALPAGIRQAATLGVLLDSLDPREHRETYWAGLGAVAAAVQRSAGAAAAIQEPLAASLYFNLRARVATSLAAMDLASALEWAAPIPDDAERLSCLVQIAAREVAPQARTWAARQPDGSGYLLYCEQPDSDQTISFQVIAVPGETIGDYYIRLRDTLSEHVSEAP